MASNKVNELGEMAPGRYGRTGASRLYYLKPWIEGA